MKTKHHENWQKGRCFIGIMPSVSKVFVPRAVACDCIFELVDHTSNSSEFDCHLLSSLKGKPISAVITYAQLTEKYKKTRTMEQPQAVMEYKTRGPLLETSYMRMENITQANMISVIESNVQMTVSLIEIRPYKIKYFFL